MSYPAVKGGVKEVLTPEIWEACKDKKDDAGLGLVDYFGMNMHEADKPGKYGIRMGDPSGYETFKEFLNPMILKYHEVPASIQHKQAPLDVNQITGEIKYPERIKSTRVRCARHVEGFAFPPGQTREQRVEVENLMKGVFDSFSGDLKGSYYSLTEDKAKCQEYEDRHFMFLCNGDGGLQAAGIMKDWPENRGIFVNESENFCSWVGEEDMIRVISMRQGSDVKGVLSLWMKGLNAMEAHLNSQGKKFLVHPKFGYLACCPTNIGTGMRASVHVELPGWKKKGGLKVRALELGLQARGARGESVEDGDDPTFDISNHKRMGYTEVELCNTMINGLNQLMDEDLAIQKELGME